MLLNIAMFLVVRTIQKSFFKKKKKKLAQCKNFKKIFYP